jgi:diguanylate cyclase (GGDEF)-like protein
VTPAETHSLHKLRQELCDTKLTPSLNAPSARAADPCLVHIHPTGPSLGRRHPIGLEPVVIGRENTCTVVVPDGSVSRSHARIELGSDGRYRVYDLGSTNGTYVNNARVAEADLSDGDYLRIGNCLYRFLAGGNIEAEYHEEIHRLTVLDPLTGLHNRRSLDEFLDRELERARRYQRPLAVALFDIDHFKAINDRLGHLGGDLTLKGVSVRIKNLTRKDEMLARYGGEEFALVLPECELAGAFICAERARKAVADQPFECEGRSYPVTVSAGLGVMEPGEQLAAPDLLRRADDRLYEAKRGGRNRIAPTPRPEPAAERP